jgi:hypothetical protein
MDEQENLISRRGKEAEGCALVEKYMSFLCTFTVIQILHWPC